MRALRSPIWLCATAALFANVSKADEAQIASAMSAAPAEVAAKATIVNADGKVLREGSNGFTCWSSVPFAGDRPMCVDAGWTRFIDALLAGEAPPERQTVAVGYWLQGVPRMSNSDPGASLEQAMADGHEIIEGHPHLALLVPDSSALAALPTTPDHGTPWVMWGDTPYAHIMVPAPPPN